MSTQPAEKECDFTVGWNAAIEKVRESVSEYLGLRSQGATVRSKEESERGVREAVRISREGGDCLEALIRYQRDNPNVVDDWEVWLPAFLYHLADPRPYPTLLVTSDVEAPFVEKFIQTGVWEAPNETEPAEKGENI